MKAAPVDKDVAPRRITSASVSVPAREVIRAPSVPRPAPRSLRARLRAAVAGSLMPVGVGVAALLVTVAVGRIRNSSPRQVVRAAAVPTPPLAVAPVLVPLTSTPITPVFEDPAALAQPAAAVAPAAARNRRRGGRADQPSVAAPISIGEAPAAPAPIPPAVQASAAPAIVPPPANALEPAPAPPRVGQRLHVRARPPRPIDIGDPYTP